MSVKLFEYVYNGCQKTFGAFSGNNVTSWTPVKGVENKATLSSIAHNYHTDTLNILYTRQVQLIYLILCQSDYGVYIYNMCVCMCVYMHVCVCMRVCVSVCECKNYISDVCSDLHHG